jgi:hypothetical protein
VCADVAEGSCAEERIADGVHEHISIGVSGEPSLIGDFDAAQDELAPWGKLMKVYSDADAHGISIILSGAEIRETIISLGLSEC